MFAAMFAYVIVCFAIIGVVVTLAFFSEYLMLLRIMRQLRKHAASSPDWYEKERRDTNLGNLSEVYAESFLRRHPQLSEHRLAIVKFLDAHQRRVTDLLATFPRSSQNQTVSGGVQGAHEGTTADKSVALAESSLSSPPPEEFDYRGDYFCIACPEKLQSNPLEGGSASWMHWGNKHCQQRGNNGEYLTREYRTISETQSSSPELLPTQLPKEK